MTFDGDDSLLALHRENFPSALYLDALLSIGLVAWVTPRLEIPIKSRFIYGTLVKDDVVTMGASKSVIFAHHLSSSGLQRSQ